MKVLVVAPQPFYTPRGTPLSVYYRTLVLTEQGAEVDLLVYGQGNDADIPNTRIVRIPAMRWMGHIPVGPSWKKLFLDGFMILWTIGLLLRNRYKVVHAHEEAVFWCRFLKPVFRYKLIYDMHSSLPQQLTNFAFTTSKMLIAIFRTLEDGCLRKADAVITICPDLRDYALKSGVEPKRHLLIENSIFDDVKLKPAVGLSQPKPAPATDLCIDSGVPTVVYTGTFEPYQGIDILVRSFAGVLRAVPDAKLLLVGGTPAQVEEMSSLARECGVAGSTIFTGTVDKKSAMRLTREATALVSPRRHGSNTPLKVYEQLASGKPLVATNIWSHTQVLTDKVCVLVELDPESMSRGLVAALTDKALTASLVANARQLYEDNYSRPTYVRKIRQLLELVS